MAGAAQLPGQATVILLGRRTPGWEPLWSLLEPPRGVRPGPTTIARGGRGRCPEGPLGAGLPDGMQTPALPESPELAGGDPDNSPRCLSRQPQGTQSAGPRSAEGARRPGGQAQGGGGAGAGPRPGGGTWRRAPGPARAGIRPERGEDAEGGTRPRLGAGPRAGGVAWAPGPPDGKRAAAWAGTSAGGAGARVTGRDRGWAPPPAGAHLARSEHAQWSSGVRADTRLCAGSLAGCSRLARYRPGWHTGAIFAAGASRSLCWSFLPGKS